mmetsp:Transcript_14519/g.23078  ORF Transcript_14519/g.23078 Transcript_14519/m.23078 type:complete len:228 (+) Transcript_14519:52-735(+)
MRLLPLAFVLLAHATAGSLVKSRLARANMKQVKSAKLRSFRRAARWRPRRHCIGAEKDSTIKEVSSRRSFMSIAGASVPLLMIRQQADAYDGSTPTVPVEVTRWEDVSCPAGSPSKMRCIRVYAKVNNKFKKLAPASELYGYVEYDDGNPALWNDDVKRIANIQNIKPGEQEVSFDLQLRKLAGLTGKEDLLFKKLTARMYFSNMYSAKPLGVVDCDEVDSAECEEP